MDELKINTISIPGESTFFGYYGIRPDNGENLHLVMSTNCIKELPNEEVLNIYSYDLKSKATKKIGVSHLWNWQQGCLARWLTKNTIAFNDFNYETNEPCCVLMNIETGQRDYLSGVVYDFSKKGDLYCTIPSGRITTLRPAYGFSCLNHISTFENSEEYALKVIRTSNRSTEFSINLDQLSKITKFNKEKAWIDHPYFSPDGGKIVFYLRELKGDSFETKLIGVNLKTHEVKIFPNISYYSHLCWVDDGAFIVFCAIPNKSKKNNTIKIVKLIAKKILQSAYLKIVRSKRFNKIKSNILSNGYCHFHFDNGYIGQVFKSVNADGHPTINPVHNNILLTDTYTDSMNQQSVLISNLESGSDLLITKFDADPIKSASSANRCDLHPRWLSDGQKISVDSEKNGHREILLFDVGKSVSAINSELT